MTFRKDDKNITNAWAFYDWANSVFPLVMISAIFPAFYTNVTETQFNSEAILFFGIKIKNSVIYEYALSFSFLVVAFLSPILSGVADYSGNKKSFMRFFVYLGSLATLLLVAFNGINIEFGLGVFIIANIGFNGSLVFYNAYLPEIASPKNMDKLSAKGYSMGYFGSTLLLLMCLLLIMTSHLTGLKGNTAIYISFVLVAAWWFGFSHKTFRHLPSRKNHLPEKKNTLSKGYKELLTVFKALKKNKTLLSFLWSFFFMSMGIQTVIYVASLFGSSELNLDTIFLISSILIIQIVAIGGAFLFSKLSSIKGNIVALSIGLMIWIIVCIAAYFVEGKTGFFSIAVLVGIVLGGTQSLARSTYSKLIPQSTSDHASYFSFYEFSEKIAIVIGTFMYAFIDHLTNSMRYSVLVLLLFFVAGIILLQRLKSEESLSVTQATNSK